MLLAGIGLVVASAAPACLRSEQPRLDAPRLIYERVHANVHIDRNFYGDGK